MTAATSVRNVADVISSGRKPKSWISSSRNALAICCSDAPSSTSAAAAWMSMGSVPAPRSVAEVPLAGDDHRHAMLVRGRDQLFVALAAAGLHDGRRTGLRADEQAVGEREERVAADDRALRARPGLVDGELRGVDAAHLSGADADGAAAAVVGRAREHDRVRL